MARILTPVMAVSPSQVNKGRIVSSEKELIMYPWSVFKGIDLGNGKRAGPLSSIALYELSHACAMNANTTR